MKTGSKVTIVFTWSQSYSATQIYDTSIFSSSITTMGIIYN